MWNACHGFMAIWSDVAPSDFEFYHRWSLKEHFPEDLLPVWLIPLLLMALVAVPMVALLVAAGDRLPDTPFSAVCARRQSDTHLMVA